MMGGQLVNLVGIMTARPAWCGVGAVLPPPLTIRCGTVRCSRFWRWMFPFFGDTGYVDLATRCTALKG